MKELHDIEMCLISQVQTQCGDLKKVNTKELGEVIDMIKDLEEAIYYCSITRAMTKSNDWDYHVIEMDKKDISRHIYDDKNNLESYVSDLSEDLTHMVKESSKEEKQMLSDKLQQIATTIK